MNENIAEYINRNALPEAGALYLRRLARGSLTEDRQRMKIIQELIELYDAYDLIGCEQMTDKILQRIRDGDDSAVIELYDRMLKDTRRAEIADVVIASLTLKTLLAERPYSKTERAAPGRTFIEMIRSVSEGCSADSMISWAVQFSNTHGIQLEEQIRIKLYYNGIRKDWVR